MVTPVKSRFALLTLDDDGDTEKKVKHVNKKKPEPTQQSNNLKPDKKKKKPDGSTQQVSQANQNKNLNGTKPKTKTGKGGEKRKKQTEKLWEQWKEKDAQLVDGTYEDDLQEAILLSQLDYEENKEYYDQIKKEQEESKKGNKKVKKSNRPQPMSLGQFNNLTDAQIELGDVGGGDVSNSHEVNGKPEADPEFFERIKSDAKKAFQAEQAEAKRKVHEPMIDEVITLAQYKDRLEQSNLVKASLMEEVQQLKEEIQKVKLRNQKLCELLFKGEMQNMAELLVTVDKLQKVKDELSTEVSSLHVQLEQERSKVRALTGDNKHSNKKKGVKFDASSETSSSKDKEKR